MPRKRSPYEIRRLQRLWKDYVAVRPDPARDAPSARADSLLNELYTEYAHLVKNTRCKLLDRLPRRICEEDLLAVGRRALVRAIQQFDPARKVGFESFAITMIRGNMKELLRTEDPVSRTTRDRGKYLHSLDEAAGLKYGVENVTDAHRAEAGGHTFDEYYELVLKATVLVQVPLNEGGGGSEMFDSDGMAPADIVAAEGVDTFEETLLNERNRDLRGRAGRLPDKEARVIELHYWSDMTFKQVAVAMKLSESRIHQIHKSALDTLRQTTREQPELYPTPSRSSRKRSRATA